MNTNQLAYFISVAETLNFTKAAQKHFISQTAMTQQIRALENTIGVPLFLRDKHHVELTPAGRAYLGEARIILQRSEDAMRLARMASAGIEGELTVGYISGYGRTDFSPRLRQFHRAYPNIKINLLRNNMSVLMDTLVHGECDAALAVLPSIPPSQSIRSQFLCSYPVMAVMYAGHPLAERERLTYADLKDEHFIMMEPSNRPKDQMEEALLIYRRGGFLPDVTAIEGEPETLLLMISAGMGISILPEYIVRPYRNDPDLRILPLSTEDDSAEAVDFEIIWDDENTNPALQQFLNTLRQNI